MLQLVKQWTFRYLQNYMRMKDAEATLLRLTVEQAEIENKDTEK